VLVVAGQLKRAEPDLNEEALLMRALRDFNIPKIVQADEVVFFGLLNDLFPDLNPPRVFDEELSECIGVACDSAGLWPDPFFTLKVRVCVCVCVSYCCCWLSHAAIIFSCCISSFSCSHPPPLFFLPFTHH